MTEQQAFYAVYKLNALLADQRNYPNPQITVRRDGKEMKESDFKNS